MVLADDIAELLWPQPVGQRMGCLVFEQRVHVWPDMGCVAHEHKRTFTPFRRSVSMAEMGSAANGGATRRGRARLAHNHLRGSARWHFRSPVPRPNHIPRE